MRAPKLLLVLLLALATGCATPREAAPTAPPPPPVAEVATPEEPAAPEAPETPPDDVPEAELLPAEAPAQWHHLDATADGVPGISTHRAYELLAGREPQRTVVVAVIDSGVDVEHEDLQGMIWTNQDEIPGNGADDDGNGYADDLYGWNFLGGPDGSNVEHDTYEVTREVVRLRPRYEHADPETLSAEEQEEYAYYQRLVSELESQQAEWSEALAQVTMIQMVVEQAIDILQAQLGTLALTPEAVAALPDGGPDVQQAKEIYRFMMTSGFTLDDIETEREHIEGLVAYGYNPDFDPRPIVGDDYSDLDERYYGNPDVKGPAADHGTGVAGVIAAARGNGLGLDGIGGADVRIMAIRAVPMGDERDKDVANAIRYAVDNGAHIVNMSFGKRFSPGKSEVDEAVRYAEEQGVLLVHAAGNDGRDLETRPSYPSRYYADSTLATNWLEVGASAWADTALVASFSNFGTATVDVFAPGAAIDVLAPGNAYDRADGTSFAAPVVSGLAALLLSYYPDLTPLDVRDIIIESATPYHGVTVTRPGDGEVVDFATLSATGGIVNAYEAVRLAEERSGR